MVLFWCGNLNNTPFRRHYLPPFLKVKMPRHSLGRPSRSDLVLSEDKEVSRCIPWRKNATGLRGEK